jgi:hypothetical protein
MIRIRTKLDSGTVKTLPWHGTWITMTHYNDKRRTQSISTDSLREAGENHLQACLALKQMKIYEPVLPAPLEEEDWDNKHE